MHFSLWFNYGSLNMYRHKFKKYLCNIHTPFIIICSILPHFFPLCNFCAEPVEYIFHLHLAMLEHVSPNNKGIS